MAQQLAKALDDGKAQAGAAVVGMAFVEAAKFFEDFFLQGGRNAGALVVYLDADMVAIGPVFTAATDDDATLV